MKANTYRFLKPARFGIFPAVCLLLLAASTLMMGCDEDFLVRVNTNELNQEVFWKTEEDAFRGVIATYAQIQADNRWNFFEMHYTSMNYKADDIRATRKDLPFAARLAAFTYGSDNVAPTVLWGDYYNGIFYANQVLENVPNIEMDATKKAQFLAEAHFFRGYYHFALLTLFNNIPLVTDTPKDQADFTSSQSASEAVWAQIEDDFAAAAADLPATWPSEYLGRITSGAAQAYLGKAKLFQGKWSEAATDLQTVVSSGTYSLLPNFVDNFNGSNENGSESLFEIQHSSKRPNNLTESTPFFPEQAPGALSGWEEFFPSDWIFDQMMEDTTAAGEPSDRVFATIFFDHPDSEADGASYSSIKDDLGNEKLFYKKYMYRNDLSDGSITRAGINIHLMRYSDVLLMLAEALNENGSTGEAIDIINQVRERSSAVPISGLSQAELREHIRNVERPVELAMELGIRWFDLVRWGEVQQTMVDHRKVDAANFQAGVHEYYGIPLSEITRNPNLVQNPGF